MNKSAELKAKAQAALAKIKALNDAAEAANRDLTADETTQSDALQAEVKSHLAAVERLKAVNDMTSAVEAIATTPVAATDTTGVIERTTQPTQTERVPAEPERKLSGIEIVGVMAWASAKNKHSPSKTALQHLEAHSLTKLADMARAERQKLEVNKALTSLGGGGGDNVIFTPLATDFIDFLRNTSVFLSSNPIELDMSYGSLKIPGGLAGATGTYGAEGAAIGYSQMTTRQVSMAAKHLRVVTAMSNYLLEVSPLAVASIVGNDVAMGLQLGIDAAGLRGDGISDNPAGLLSLVHADHTNDVADNIEPSYEEIELEVKAALTLWRSSNVPRIRPVWIMSNRVFTYLQFLRDGNGNWIYPGLHLPTPVWVDNIPAKRSEQVPSNLGSGTNESEIYLQDFGHVLFGITRAIKLDSSTEASYVNGSAAHVSAFSQDETVIRGVASHDFDMRHTKSGAIMQKVKWGAAA